MDNPINEKISEMEESMKEKQKSLNEIQNKFYEFMKPKGIKNTKFGSAVILANNVLMLNCNSEAELKEIIRRLKK